MRTVGSNGFAYFGGFGAATRLSLPSDTMRAKDTANCNCFDKWALNGLWVGRGRGELVNVSNNFEFRISKAFATSR